MLKITFDVDGSCFVVDIIKINKDGPATSKPRMILYHRTLAK